MSREIVELRDAMVGDLYQDAQGIMSKVNEMIQMFPDKSKIPYERYRMLQYQLDIMSNRLKLLMQAT